MVNNQRNMLDQQDSNRLLAGFLGRFIPRHLDKFLYHSFIPLSILLFLVLKISMWSGYDLGTLTARYRNFLNFSDIFCRNCY